MMEDKKKQKPRRQSKPPAPQGLVSPFLNGFNAISGENPAFTDNMGRELLFSDADPEGSYTGITRYGDDRPVQDADDL